MSIDSCSDQHCRHLDYIQRAVDVYEITGKHNLVAYREDYKETYGYWLCSTCHQTASSGGAWPIHREECELEDGLKNEFSHMIYVLGPNEDGEYFPQFEKNIELIKRLAEERCIAKTRTSRKTSSLPDGLNFLKTDLLEPPSPACGSEKHSRRSISMPNLESFKALFKSFSPTSKPESSEGSLSGFTLHLPPSCHYNPLYDDEKMPTIVVKKPHKRHVRANKKNDKEH